MDVKSSQATGNAAMHYAAWQLSRKGWNVMPTARNAKGSDLFCANDDESIMFGVQSKGLSKKVAVPCGTSLDNLRSDWWIITVGPKGENPTCFILTLAEVKALCVRSDPAKSKTGTAAYWLPAKCYMHPEFQEAWHRLEGGSVMARQELEAEGVFDVGDVVDTHQEGHVTFRKHSSGSYTALVHGKQQPARKLLLDLRDRMGLPDKANNTTRTLGAQVFGELRN